MAYSEQLQLIPPETRLERTLRTGSIDPLGQSLYSIEETVTIFDDVLERPDHYYGKDHTPAASFLGGAMLHQSVEAIYQGTTQDIGQLQDALLESVMQHLKHEMPEDMPDADSAFELQEGIRLERTALDMLNDAVRSPRFIFNVLRSDNGFNAKVFCLIMDAPGKTIHFSALQSKVEEPERVEQALRQLRRADCIKTEVAAQYWDGYEEDPDPRYTHNDYFRYEEDSEVMALARFHARRYSQARESCLQD